jgi:hypothetical protein
MLHFWTIIAGGLFSQHLLSTKVAFNVSNVLLLFMFGTRLKQNLHLFFLLSTDDMVQLGNDSVLLSELID